MKGTQNALLLKAPKKVRQKSMYYNLFKDRAAGITSTDVEGNRSKPEFVNVGAGLDLKTSAGVFRLAATKAEQDLGIDADFEKKTTLFQFR
jgi:hypothetical protein